VLESIAKYNISILGLNITFVSFYFLFSALDPGYVLSFNGVRNFLLCKKQIEAPEEKSVSQSVTAGKRGNILSLKTGLNKLLSFSI
jgi:hypothetical protein